MVERPKINLEEYKNACERLKREIDLAILDLEFTNAGNKLLYAVDFSEIFSYVLPSESFRDFAVFPADRGKKIDTDTIALQQLVLRYIFFDLSPTPKPILLSPYLLEFRTFIRDLPSKLFLEAIKRTEQVFNDLEKVLIKNVDHGIEMICHKIEEQSDYTPSEQEEEILAKFVQDFGYIDSFLETGTSEKNPFTRIKQLQPSKAFIGLNDLFPELKITDTEIYDRWVQDLRNKRGRASSTELDAAAMNLIYYVNQRLSPDTRLVLITRSTSMQQLYQQEFDAGLWTDAGDYPLLRHPRAFSNVLSATQMGSSDNVQDLLVLSEAIGFFLDSYKTWKPNEAVNEETLMKQITIIKQTWRNIQKTAFPLVATSSSAEGDTKVESARQARRIIAYAKNHQDVRQKIVKILDDLFSSIDFSYDLLELELQAPQNLLEISNDHSKFTIHSSYFFNPYQVNFRTEAGKKILNQLSGKAFIQTRDVISAFRLAFEQGKEEKKERRNEDYDRSLAMAYILGSLINQWEIAEKYCLRAIKVGERTNTSTHEALYYQAICKRQIQTDSSNNVSREETFGEILNLLDKAIALASKYVDDRTIARYWIEKGITILSFHAGSLNTEPSETLPNATEALNILAEWDKKLGDQLPLRLFTLRAELDYIVGDKRFRELPRLQEKFLLLEKQLMQSAGQSSEWPPYIVDLIFWGKSVFSPYENKDIVYYRRLVKRLREANESEINREIKQGIYRHIKEIQGKIAILSTAS